MHEMSIAMSVIDLASARAQEESATRINQIELEIGALAGVMIDSLEFCFEVARKDSMADGAKLKIVSVPGQGKCLDCQKEFQIDSFFALCPHCGGFRVNITQGKDMRLKSIDVD